MNKFCVEYRFENDWQKENTFWTVLADDAENAVNKLKWAYEDQGMSAAAKTIKIFNVKELAQ